MGFGLVLIFVYETGPRAGKYLFKCMEFSRLIVAPPKNFTGKNPSLEAG